MCFSSRRRHTRYWRDWSSDVCSSDLRRLEQDAGLVAGDRGGVALGPALALDEGEVERDGGGEGGLAVAARHEDHRLPEAPGGGAALDEAEQVGEEQTASTKPGSKPHGPVPLDRKSVV